MEKIEGDYPNTIAIGAICAALEIEPKLVENNLTERFKSKGEQVVKDNLAAAQKGFQLVKEKLGFKPAQAMAGRVLIIHAPSVVIPGWLIWFTIIWSTR